MLGLLNRQRQPRHAALLTALLAGVVLAGCGGGERAASNPDPDLEAVEIVEEGSELPGLKGTIVFVSDRSGQQKIWSTRAGGTHFQRLTRGQDPDAWPRFSPNGRQIVYTALRAGHAEVWLMNRDGSNPVFLSHGEQAAWAPDGEAVAFLRDQQVYVRALASGAERLVAPAAKNATAPVWRPDGKMLAISGQDAANIATLLLDIDGAKMAPLKTEEPCHALRWSRDSKKILCESATGHIVQVDADGENWEQLTEGADLQQQACYSPDGSRILFCRAADAAGPWQLYVQDLASENVAALQLTRHGSNWQPDWHAGE